MSHPILYSTTETNFDHSGIGELEECMLCEVTEERNGAYELVMKYPLDGAYYNQLKDRSLVKVALDKVRGSQVFRIYSVSKPLNGIVTFNAQHLSYDLSGIPTSPFSADMVDDALSGLGKNAVTVCPFSFWTDKSTKAKFEIFAPASIRSRLGGVSGSILDVYGGEYEFDNYTIKLHDSRGKNCGVRVLYGVNMTDIKQDENCANVYTGILPYWNADEGVNLVTLPEKVVKASGEYNFEKIKVVDFSDDFEVEPTEEELRSAAEKYIKDNSIGVPSVSLKVSFEQLDKDAERVGLCDTVNVEFPALKVNATAKVVKTVYDVLLDRVKSVTLGNAKTNIADTINDQKNEIDNIKDTIPSKTDLEKAVENATKWITNGNGYMVAVKDKLGNWKEICSLDTPDIETAVNVWRWNNGGFGHSSSGYDGPYETAITQDGQIVADFITAGSLTASLIKAGVLKSADGETFYLDLENGILRMKASSFLVEGKSVEDIANDAAKKVADDLNEFSENVTSSLTDLQNQIDGAIETWFYDYEPTASNAPASSWTTTEDKNKHLGDLFYIIDNEDKGGLVYRWALVNGVYGWILVEDTEVAKALETASQAKDTADGKRRVFVAQPKPPYDVGDLWTNNTDLYVCQTARAAGNYTASDWKLATEYTTEKAVKALIEVTEKSIKMRVESVEKTVDGIAVGGRNLLKGTRDFSGFRVYPDGFISIEENGDFSNARFNEDIPEGAGLKYVTSSPNPINLAEVLDQEVVFSFEIASPDDFKSAGDDIIVEFAVCGAENTTRLRYKLFYLETDVPTVWKQHVIKAKLTEDFFSGGDGNFSDATRFWVRFYSNSGNILYARKFKLELGNMATDWSTNPEETEKSVASLKITADGLSSDVKNAKGDIYKLSVKADEQATLIESANGKATEALQKAGSIYQTYTWDDGGKLEIHIDGTGRCEAVYTDASGVEQSSARFDLAARVFRFNGDIVSKNEKSTFKVEDLGLTFSRSTDVGTEAYDHSSFKLALNEVLSKYYPSLFMGGRSYEDSSLYIRCYENGIWIGNLHVPTNVSRFDAPMDGGLGLFINTETGNVSLHTKETAKYAFEAVFA